MLHISPLICYEYICILAFIIVLLVKSNGSLLNCSNTKTYLVSIRDIKHGLNQNTTFSLKSTF